MFPRETPPHRGRFITIDGSDGSARTREEPRLRAHLAIRDRERLLTREPGGIWLVERLSVLPTDDPKPAFERTIQ